MHGVSTKIEEKLRNPQGQEPIEVCLCYHVTRKPGYYFWKALLPLYLLTALSMTTFHFETDNLSDRSSTVSTYFLAAFAMLYVVGAALPKTDFLTKIDSVIVLTTVSLAFTGVASLGIAKLHTDQGEEVAGTWNLGIEISILTIYLFSNLCIFMPPFITQFRGKGRLTRYKRPTNADSEALSEGGCDLPPTTVEHGADYYTLEFVKQGQF
eukprot:SAG11_NODE_6676_length_1269_cov_1.089744_1_plen_210_part_00